MQRAGESRFLHQGGIIIAVLSIVSMIIGLIGGGEFSITSLVLNLLLPVLYVYGALQMKGSISA